MVRDQGLLLRHRCSLGFCQCEDCVTECFPVAIPFTAHFPSCSRDDLTAPWSRPPWTVWQDGQRYEPYALDPRLRVEPLPEGLGDLGIVPVLRDHGPATVVHASPATRVSAMPLQGMQLVQIGRIDHLPGWPAWGTPALPVLTPLPAREGNGELGLEIELLCQVAGCRHDILPSGCHHSAGSSGLISSYKNTSVLRW